MPEAGAGRPYMLLITVIEPKPEKPFEVSLSLEQECICEHWTQQLRSGNTQLDGVYMEWSPRLAAEDAESLASLCQKFKVGVWNYAGQPDSLEKVTTLMNLGVSFVNTDLPSDFTPQKMADVPTMFFTDPNSLQSGGYTNSSATETRS